MHDYQRDFIRLTLQREVLRFGEFTLKSGRQSPYFFNMGRIDSGAALAQLGRAYAAALMQSGVAVDMLFWGLDALEMVAAVLRGDPWFAGPDWDREGAARPGVVRARP